MYNPLNYSLPQLQKALISLVYLAGVCLMLVLNDFDPGITEALIALIGPVFGVVQVFLSKNATPDDVTKALEQVKATAITFISFFVAVPSSTEEKLVLLIGGLVTAYFVFKRPNVPGEPPAPAGS